jgi:molybdate transport system substrate-binding protein
MRTGIKQTAFGAACGRRGLAVLVLLGLCLPVQAEEIRVAVASNFTTAMRPVVEAFEARTGHRVELSFGSSGNLYAQITNGAPFHAFFSADQSKPMALEAQGLAEAGTRFTYAVGTLVLWSRTPAHVDTWPERLSSGDFKRLAMANPRVAPYGAAAVEVLRELGVAEATRSRWVQGENVAQAFQYVYTGNADLGFVALSQVIDRGGSYWTVPARLHQPIRQDAVLLKRGADNAGAQALLEFFTSEQAGKIIRARGYTVPVTMAAGG